MPRPCMKKDGVKNSATFWDLLLMQLQMSPKDILGSLIPRNFSVEGGISAQVNRNRVSRFFHIFELHLFVTLKFTYVSSPYHIRLYSCGHYTTAMIIDMINVTLRKEGKLLRSLEEIERRIELEKQFLESTTRSSWELDSYNKERVSGSLAWKITRGEVGNKSGMGSAATIAAGVARESNSLCNRNSVIASTKAIEVETFMPKVSETFQIIVKSRPSKASRCFPECITVSGVACGAGIRNTISIVVVDQNNSCVLLSRLFSSWSEALSFLLFIPDGRVIALVSDITVEESEETFVQTHIKRISALSSYSVSMHRCSADNARWTGAGAGEGVSRVCGAAPGFGLYGRSVGGWRPEVFVCS